MKEEKKKSSKIIATASKKNIQIPYTNQISVHSEFYKQSAHIEGRKQTIANKHMKRIGCKSIIKAYSRIVDESVLKQLDYSNQTEIVGGTKENKKQRQQKNKRKLKRIGHKKIINAYKQMISEMEKNQSAKKIQKQSQNRISQCDHIKIEQCRQDEQRHPNEQNINLDSFQNKSLIKQSIIENSVPLADSIVIRKIISEDGANGNSDSFAININMVSNGTENASKDMKMENSSIFDKSDGCLESFNTESDHRVSQSVIIHGSFERLIDESEINSNAEIDQDEGQIKQLVEQINKNLQFNTNRQQQTQKQQQLQKLQPTHLVVPNNKKLDARTSINKKIQQKPQDQTEKNQQTINSVHQPRKQQGSEQIEQTQQEKLLQIIEQKYKKNKNGKRNSKAKKSTLVKRNIQQKRTSQYNPKQTEAEKKSPKRRSKQMNDKLIDKDKILEEMQNKENNNLLNHNTLKKPLPEPFPSRENIQKSSHIQKDDYILKSNASLLLAPVQLGPGENKMQKKLIQTKEFKASSNHISVSMHDKAEGSHQKDWINGKSNKKIYKKAQEYESSPSNSHNKRSNQKFQLNKCVNQARKLLTNSVHF